MSKPRQTAPYDSDANVIRLTGFQVQAESAGEDNSDAPVWSQIAKAGEYKGYDPPFNLTAEHFNQMVANFRAHPGYKAGANGVGNSDVVPWDFHHLSDPNYWDENTAQIGTPAQGWIQELQVKIGMDGKAELWALTRWLPLAKQYVRNSQYKWASIDFTFNTTDPVSGKPAGAYLISVALTNDPFIQGMQALAASRDFKPGRILAGYWDAAENAGEAMSKIKDALGIAETAEISVLAAELAKLRQWVTSGSTPIGIDLQKIFGTMRNILNLPALSGEVDVLNESDKLVTRLLEEQAIQSGQPPAPMFGEEINNAMVAGGRKMPELMKALAKAFGVRETEAEVQAAADDSVSLRAGLQRTLAAERDATKVLLDAVQGVVAERDGLNERAVALTKALGLTKDEDPIVRIVALQKSEKDLAELTPKYAELAAEIDKQNAVQAEAQVDEAMRLHNMPEATRDALLLFRCQEPEKFAEKFPLTPPQHAHLTATLTTGTRQATATAPDASNVIELSQYAGRNDAEKLAHYILATNPGAKNWTQERLFGEVHAMRQAQKGR